MKGRKLKSSDWLMVEGYMDVIALQQYGITGAVATLGTASNTEHLNILFKQNSRITIAFDGDAAGQKAARRTLEIALPLLNDGRELKFLFYPMITIRTLSSVEKDSKISKNYYNRPLFCPISCLRT